METSTVITFFLRSGLYVLRKGVIHHGGAIPLPNVRKLPQHPSKRYGKGDVYQNSIAKLAASHIREELCNG
jgi:hypothetical protein